jgi:hypothetical protein
MEGARIAADPEFAGPRLDWDVWHDVTGAQSRGAAIAAPLGRVQGTHAGMR